GLSYCYSPPALLLLTPVSISNPISSGCNIPGINGHISNGVFVSNDVFLALELLIEDTMKPLGLLQVSFPTIGNYFCRILLEVTHLALSMKAVRIWNEKRLVNPTSMGPQPATCQVSHSSTSTSFLGVDPPNLPLFLAKYKRIAADSMILIDEPSGPFLSTRA